MILLEFYLLNILCNYCAIMKQKTSMDVENVQTNGMSTLITAADY